MRVVQDNEVIGDWAGAQLNARFQEPFTAYGFASPAGIITAASVFNDYYPGGNIEWTHVGTLRPAMLRFLCRFVFEELSATRVTAKTRRGNVAVRTMLGRAMTYECTHKRFFGPTKDDDALVFCMFREDAGRWLRRTMN